MFTGIIEEVAVVRSVSDQGFWLDVSFSRHLNIGQSVACNGVCLTIVEKDEKGFRVDLLEETKRVTAFSELEEGSLINLERAMKADGRFDGHIVQAHSEGVGTLNQVRKERNERNDRKDEAETFLLTVEVPRALMKYMIVKGIVILNGIALTITKLDDQKAEIEVAIIPHTWENTNLHMLKTGSKVNVETDVLAKYLERLMMNNKQ